MKKLLVIWALALCIMTAFSAAAFADEGSYTEKTVKLFIDGEEAGEQVLRFYEVTPNIPYMGVNGYSQLMRHQPITLIREEDGTITLKSGSGAEAVCDAQAGVITVPDWNAFFDLPYPLENEARGWKDTSLSCIRITDIAYEGEPEPVELDFSKYGIRLYAEQDDIYLPVAVLSNMMTDIATNHMLYNGENLYARKMDINGLDPAPDYWDSQKFKDEIEKDERPEDLVQECYAELCFNFDHFFGHPGKAMLDEAIGEKGLDQALTDMGPEGIAIREGLLSPSFSEYQSAMQKLFMICLSDGHTTLMSIAPLKEDPSVSSFLSTVIGTILDILRSPSTMSQIVHLLIPLERAQTWGNEIYRESGSTAIIQLDGFMPDEKAWREYYDGTGDFPDDSLGIVVSGLRRASENPDIENVIFDLSCNSGGSPDVMMTILAMTTGQTQLYGIHKMTGQKMVFTFETDTNFDGVYDEKDREVRYDYNFGVLTTRHAFSCGNLFPIITQEAGAVLIGEPTSGGSCCVQMGTDSDGSYYVMSSGQWQLTDSQFVTVEGGCETDIPIRTEGGSFIDTVVTLLGLSEGAPSFKEYFDEARLDGLMNGWFRAEAELAA